MRLLIGGLKKTSLLDYPDKISAIVFMQGCNFNCGYCHNPGLLSKISKNDIYSTDVFFEFLNKRKGKLDGVVITGGEATLQPDLKPFIQSIKNMGFLVKLDTNGYKPDILENLLADNLLDYIAMDIKAPLEKYSSIVRIDTDVSKIQKSIDIIMSSNVDYEFRTTVLSSMLSFEDFEKIAVLIKGAKKYYLQKFAAESEINDMNLFNNKTYSDEEFFKLKSMLNKYINFVDVR